MKKFTHVQVFAEGLIAHGVNDNETKKQVDIWEVRGGIAGPTASRPGYAVFFGMGRERNVAGKNPLIFLDEREEKLQGQLLQKVSDDTIRLRCTVIYADRGSKRTLEGFYGSLWKHLQDKNLNTINLIPAPSSDNPEYGAALIQEYLTTKSLKMLSTETILKTQLSQMTTENLRDEPYSFKALRFVLAGFSKYPQPQPSAFARGGFKIHKNVDRRDPLGWT